MIIKNQTSVSTRLAKLEELVEKLISDKSPMSIEPVIPAVTLKELDQLLDRKNIVSIIFDSLD